ncbi:FAD-binding oxidoreductase [Pseudolysinimonas yzui]|uniref:Oxidoreductase n=1 Tax=Pseudolysinimonas yzui TaxID=2708254 RepID=A0A8J3GPI9_9MICO|nr:FAD-binding oxidoreductase [Pseudolysinimonas yzui]GHF11635.1 oxidoreductase [Pseudolysinimonas yzui]
MVNRIRPAWLVATVTEVLPETATARRIVLDVPGWPGNDAGSHLDIRLTAPDGYQASRSYSIASYGPSSRVVLSVDDIPTGEVSPFLTHELRAGDQIEVHGPLGAYFVWRPAGFGSTTGPVQLIGGGSGIVPLYAIARAAADAGRMADFRLLTSVRSPEDQFFATELDALAAAGLRIDRVYTRAAPSGWPVAPGRLTRDSLAAVIPDAATIERSYVCGPTPFVEAVAGWLIDLGHSPGTIRTERFGG